MTTAKTRATRAPEPPGHAPGPDFLEFAWVWNARLGQATPGIHRRIARWFDARRRDGDGRLLLMAFRGCGKSTLVGLWCAWTLLRELAARIPSVREPVASLSGGQRQTVAIARSLLLDPKIIMLDEPTAALGVAQTAEVLNLIERVRDRGLGVILISHNMEDVRAVADRIVVLRLGRNNGVFTPDSSNQDLVASITGATENAVSRRIERKTGAPHETSGRPA